jgi:spore coat protein U-like protein
MNNVSKLALALGMALALPAAAFAGSATKPVTVTATVSNTCNISAATLAFGTYDGLNGTSDVDGSAVLQYQCNNKTAPKIGLDAGQNSASATGTTRAMSHGTDYLSYELYTDTGRLSVWGNVATSWLAPGAVSSNSVTSATIYGRIPAAQDAPTGSYSDTVTATINF